MWYIVEVADCRHFVRLDLMIVIMMESRKDRANGWSVFMRLPWAHRNDHLHRVVVFPAAMMVIFVGLFCSI